MIVCSQCGHENQDQQEFCASCHAYLEWDRSAPATGEQRRPEPERATAPAPGPEAAPGTAATTTGEGKRGETSQTPGAVLPAEERKAPPPRRSAREEASEGNLVCSACGHGNEATRTFCRRCGNRLDRKVAPAAVGPRPRRQIPWSLVVRILLGLLAVGALLVALFGSPWDDRGRGGEAGPVVSVQEGPEGARAAASGLLQAWLARDRAGGLRVAERPAVDALFARPVVEPAPVLRTCQSVGTGQFDCQFEGYKDSVVVMRTIEVATGFRVQRVSFVPSHR